MTLAIQPKKTKHQQLDAYLVKTRPNKMMTVHTTGDSSPTENSSTEYSSPLVGGEDGTRDDERYYQNDNESIASSISSDYNTLTGSTTSNDANEIATWLSRISLGKTRTHQPAALLQSVSYDDIDCRSSKAEVDSLSSQEIHEEVIFWISKLGLNTAPPHEDSELSDEEASRSGSEDEHGDRYQLSTTKDIDLDRHELEGKGQLRFPDSPTAPSSTSDTHDSNDQATLDSCHEEDSTEEEGDNENIDSGEPCEVVDGDVLSPTQVSDPSRSQDRGDDGATQIKSVPKQGQPRLQPAGSAKAHYLLQTENLLQSMSRRNGRFDKGDVQGKCKSVSDETEEEGLCDDVSSSGSSREYDSSASGSDDDDSNDDSSLDSSCDSSEGSSDGSSDVTVTGSEDDVLGSLDLQNDGAIEDHSPRENDAGVDPSYLEDTDPGPMPREEEKIEHDYSNVDMSQHFEFIQDPELKRLATKLHKRLNLDPWDGTSNLKDDYVQDFVQENPMTCQVQYFYNHFNERLFPLNMLCALNPSVQTVEATYNAFPPAAEQCDPWIGSPLHYACAYRASTDVVQFLLTKTPNTTTKLNDLQRTPLHLACVFKATMPVIQLLIKANPCVLSMKDRNGCTPLHLAVDNGGATGIVSALIRHDKSCCMSRSNSNMTPLHLACARSATRAVVKTLMDADPEAIQAVDDLGRTPLHVAAQYGAALPIVQMLVKACPDLTGEETNRGETALDLAKKHQGPPDVTSFLSEL